jgi:hypothetical protein
MTNNITDNYDNYDNYHNYDKYHNYDNYDNYDNYIISKSISKSVIQNNNKKDISEIKMNSEYDGKTANFHVDLNKNGLHKDYHFSLNNDDLLNILNIDSVQLPLDKRLKRDFKNRPKIIQFEFDNDQNNITFKSNKHKHRRTHKVHKNNKHETTKSSKKEGKNKTNKRRKLRNIFSLL